MNFRSRATWETRYNCDVRSFVPLLWAALPLLSACKSKAPAHPALRVAEGAPAEAMPFSESSSIIDLAVTGDTVWAASTRGLLRWDLATGSSLRIGKSAGLVG